MPWLSQTWNPPASSFSFAGSNPGSHVAFSGCLLGVLPLLLLNSLSFVVLLFLSTGHLFCQMWGLSGLTGDLSNIVSWLALSSVFWAGSHRRDVCCSQDDSRRSSLTVDCGCSWRWGPWSAGSGGACWLPPFWSYNSTLCGLISSWRRLLRTTKSLECLPTSFCI